MPSGYEALTEKEKATLRLIVRGHDAKSIARHFSLSVHTVNERLRDARRKLAVSSSREAARLLLDREGGGPDYVTDSRLGEAAPAGAVARGAAPENGRAAPRPALIATGAIFMSIALALLALIAQPHLASSPAAAPPPAAPIGDPAVEATARRFLALVDQGHWAESWAETGASFRTLNTVAAWAAASEQARAPLGAMRSRTLLSHDAVPAPPAGYDVVKFRTDFANKAGAVETLSLDKENGVWRVVGIYID